MSVKTVETRWYTYRQNNSGGRFKGPALFVFVEALNAAHANQIAETAGVYFDGEGDCQCCGYRWDRAREDSGQPEPTLEPDDWSRKQAERAGIKLAEFIPLAPGSTE